MAGVVGVLFSIMIIVQIASVRTQSDGQDPWRNLHSFNALLSKLFLPLKSVDSNNSSVTSAPVIRSINTSMECSSDQDCFDVLGVDYSCIGMDAFNNGRCLLALKPSEHGCQYDDQCRKTCRESYCATSDEIDTTGSQCRCQKGTYFLWKKCWQHCLPGTEPIHLNDQQWICQETNRELALTFLRRFKRQARRRMMC